MSYTASAALARVKTKGFISTSSGLNDSQFLEQLNDSLRTYIVPFTKALRDEWWVGRTDITVTIPGDGKITLPDTVASTLRTVCWLNNGILVPLTRIEPENAPAYSGQQGNFPYGFVLRGYTLQMMPNCPGFTVVMTAMLRPPEMVLEEDAAEVASGAGAAITLESVPVSWQESTPEEVDLISGTSPFSVISSGIPVVSLVGSVLTLGVDPGDISGQWLALPGQSPFPNIPIELHPLLEIDAIAWLYQGVGDKRLPGMLQRQDKMEKELRATMAPRLTGNAKPIVNRSAPGMNGWFGPWRRR